MTHLQIFDYEGSQITFRNGENVMVNATEMAKPFGKYAKDWLRNTQAQEFIKGLSDMRNLLSSDLVQVIHGNNGGTWMHEDVAMEFARWLSPKFAIWCNDRIKELARHGFTATPQKLKELVANPDLLIEMANALKTERERNSQLTSENEEQRVAIERKDEQIVRQQEEIEKAAPKVEYFDKTMQSTQTYTTTQIAKELGYNSANILNELLRKAGLIFHQSGQWMLASPYNAWKMHRVRTYTYDKNDGSICSNSTTVWTERGRYFIIKLHENGFSISQTIKALKRNEN